MKKIINTQPNTIRTPQNIYKGSLLIKINETDLSSPFLIIGKNSKQNEKISTQILKFNDLWFHVHEYPGGHVILRNKKIKDKIITADTNLADIIIDDDIKYAANMAAYFSKARKMEKTLVCFTLGKYVLKDNTLNEGAVEVLKYKLIYGRPNKVANIIKDLNERNKEIEICKKKKKKKNRNDKVNILYATQSNFFNPKQFKDLLNQDAKEKTKNVDDGDDCLELENVENLEEIAPELHMKLMEYKKSEESKDEEINEKKLKM
ncbi:FbpA domain protein,putative [Plasmodium gaboni]|uniref:FbpA domain protein,putative n=1 Tax=Plasmodium gaboni TaxID=647221 RepID=A0ABY1UV23_9APIC|nr:FbpA domain protein,putative [Plasmodium gaboni]